MMMITTSTHRTPRRLRSKAGYSLLEILIVIVIIGMLVALVGTQLTKILDNQKVSATRIQMSDLKKTLTTMSLDIGRYPTDAEGLAILNNNPGDAAPGWKGPYLDKAIPNDNWGHPFIYKAPSGDDLEPTIKSLGNDGKEGGTGNAADISTDDNSK